MEERRNTVNVRWRPWAPHRSLSVAALFLALFFAEFGCSDDVPSSLNDTTPSSSTPIEGRSSSDAQRSEPDADALGRVLEAPPLPKGSPALIGHVSGAGTSSSPNYRLRLSVGSPVMTTPVKSHSYQLQMLAPWTIDSEETP